MVLLPDKSVVIASPKARQGAPEAIQEQSNAFCWKGTKQSPEQQIVRTTVGNSLPKRHPKQIPELS
jgi:hypothetical protein